MLLWPWTVQQYMSRVTSYQNGGGARRISVYNRLFFIFRYFIPVRKWLCSLPVYLFFSSSLLVYRLFMLISKLLGSWMHIGSHRSTRRVLSLIVNSTRLLERYTFVSWHLTSKGITIHWNKASVAFFGYGNLFSLFIRGGVIESQGSHEQLST